MGNEQLARTKLIKRCWYADIPYTAFLPVALANIASWLSPLAKDSVQRPPSLTTTPYTYLPSLLLIQVATVSLMYVGLKGMYHLSLRVMITPWFLHTLGNTRAPKPTSPLNCSTGLAAVTLLALPNGPYSTWLLYGLVTYIDIS